MSIIALPLALALAAQTDLINPEAVRAAVPAVEIATASPKFDKILVLELASSGVETNIAKNLSEVLAQAIRKAVPNVAVIGQSDMNSMLAVERQKDVLGCASDVACLAELGGALGADHLVVGSIGKIGKQYLLSIKLLDSSQAKTVRHVSADLSEEDQLVEAVRQWGANLVVPATPTGIGYLNIQGSGEIAIDDHIIGHAPVTHYAALQGSHHLVWKNAGQLLAERSIEVEPYVSARIDMVENAPATVAGFGQIQISSEPAGVAVYLDRERVGVTPLLVPTVRAGVSHDLRLEAEGYESTQGSIQAKSGLTESVNIKLEPIAKTAVLVARASYLYYLGGLFNGGLDYGFRPGTGWNPANGSDINHFAITNGAGLDISLAWIIARHFEILLSYTRASINVKSDNQLNLGDNTIGGGTMNREMLELEYVFTPPWGLRPHIGPMVGLQQVNIDHSSYNTTSPTLQWSPQGSQGSADFGFEIGLRAELPLHIVADVSFRMGFGGLINGALGAGLGAYL